MKTSECRIHGGQEEKKMIQEDGIERGGHTLPPERGLATSLDVHP